MMPGQKQFGKEAFVAASSRMKNTHIEGTSDIQEIQIFSDWAFIRNHLQMTSKPEDGPTKRRSGFTRTILRKESDGRWRLARDANLLTEET